MCRSMGVAKCRAVTYFLPSVTKSAPTEGVCYASNSVQGIQYTSNPHHITLVTYKKSLQDSCSCWLTYPGYEVIDNSTNMNYGPYEDVLQCRAACDCDPQCYTVTWLNNTNAAAEPNSCTGYRLVITQRVQNPRAITMAKYACKDECWQRYQHSELNEGTRSEMNIYGMDESECQTICNAAERCSSYSLLSTGDCILHSLRETDNIKQQLTFYYNSLTAVRCEHELKGVTCEPGYSAFHSGDATVCIGHMLPTSPSRMTYYEAISACEATGSCLLHASSEDDVLLKFLLKHVILHTMDEASSAPCGIWISNRNDTRVTCNADSSEDVATSCRMLSYCPSLSSPSVAASNVSHISCDLQVIGGALCVKRVDWCKQSIPTCHPLATCTNTARGYSCTCNKGYIGDGVLACNPVTTRQRSTWIKYDENNNHTASYKHFHISVTYKEAVELCQKWEAYPAHYYQSIGQWLAMNVVRGDARLQKSTPFVDDTFNQCRVLNTEDGSNSVESCATPNSGGVICEKDVDECQEAQSHTCRLESSTCVNTPGSYYCQCLSGYVGYQDACLPINCGSGWKRHNEYCYFYSKHMNTGASIITTSYNEAKYMCQLMGGHLLDIHALKQFNSTEELQWVTSFLNDKQEAEIWSSRASETMCASVALHRGGVMDREKYSCENYKLPFVCRSGLLACRGRCRCNTVCSGVDKCSCLKPGYENRRTSTGWCPRGWHYSPSTYSCYFVSSGVVSRWHDARDICAQQSSTLLHIDTAVEHAWLTHHLIPTIRRADWNRSAHPDNSSFWFGLHRSINSTMWESDTDSNYKLPVTTREQNIVKRRWTYRERTGKNEKIYEQYLEKLEEQERREQNKLCSLLIMKPDMTLSLMYSKCQLMPQQHRYICKRGASPTCCYPEDSLCFNSAINVTIMPTAVEKTLDFMKPTYINGLSYVIILLGFTSMNHECSSMCLRQSNCFIYSHFVRNKACYGVIDDIGNIATDDISQITNFQARKLQDVISGVYISNCQGFNELLVSCQDSNTVEMSDTNNRHVIEMSGTALLDCISKCRADYYRYAAIQQLQQTGMLTCWCLSSMVGQKQYDMNLCYSHQFCNAAVFCGNVDYVPIYDTQLSVDGSVGCLRVDGDINLMAGVKKATSSASVDDCANKCEEADASWIRGSSCYCVYLKEEERKFFDFTTYVDVSLCDMRCSGDKQQFCGGRNDSIYTTRTHGHHSSRRKQDWVCDSENGRCYHILMQPVTYEDAKVYCSLMKGGLIGNISRTQQVFLSQILTNIRFPFTPYYLTKDEVGYWLSGFEAKFPRLDQWFDNMHWQVLEPDNGTFGISGVEEQCVVFRPAKRSSRHLLFYDENCQNKHVVICQKGENNMIDNNIDKEVCSKGWKLYNGRCYHFTEQKMTWHKAVSYCSQFGCRSYW